MLALVLKLALAAWFSVLCDQVTAPHSCCPKFIVQGFSFACPITAIEGRKGVCISCSCGEPVLDAQPNLREALVGLHILHLP